MIFQWDFVAEGVAATAALALAASGCSRTNVTFVRHTGPTMLQLYGDEAPAPPAATFRAGDLERCGLHNLEPLVTWANRRGGAPSFSMGMASGGTPADTTAYELRIEARLEGGYRFACSCSWWFRSIGQELTIEEPSFSCWIEAPRRVGPRRRESINEALRTDQLDEALDEATFWCVGTGGALDPRLAFEL